MGHHHHHPHHQRRQIWNAHCTGLQRRTSFWNDGRQSACACIPTCMVLYRAEVVFGGRTPDNRSLKEGTNRLWRGALFSTSFARYSVRTYGVCVSTAMDVGTGWRTVTSVHSIEQSVLQSAFPEAPTKRGNPPEPRFFHYLIVCVCVCVRVVSWGRQCRRRFQHSCMFLNEKLLIVGGRGSDVNKSASEQISVQIDWIKAAAARGRPLPTAIYDTGTCEWRHMVTK
eukprot:4367033-Amphidinium_carterae.1